jgi:AcrR family transcriptional regulator
MKNTYDSGTALKILEAAELEFLEKGYDGSRVDEIAKRANINKSQLYYYFGSKDNILNELIKLRITKADDIINNSFDITKVTTKDSFLSFIDELYNYFISIEKILKIAMVEMAKSNSTNFTIFELFEPIYKKIQAATEKMGIKSESATAPVSYFFIDIFPLLAFVTYSSKFSEFFKIPQEELEKQFSTAYKENQLRYFENLVANYNNLKNSESN